MNGKISRDELIGKLLDSGVAPKNVGPELKGPSDEQIIELVLTDLVEQSVTSQKVLDRIEDWKIEKARRTLVEQDQAYHDENGELVAR